MKKNFNKPLEMTKTKKTLRKLINVIFVIKKCFDQDIKVRGHCHITGR